VLGCPRRLEQIQSSASVEHVPQPVGSPLKVYDLNTWIEVMTDSAFAYLFAETVSLVMGQIVTGEVNGEVNDDLGFFVAAQAR
jgi:hypothetical protein